MFFVKAELIVDSDSYYKIIETNDETLATLLFFLMFDIGCNKQTVPFVQWLTNPNPYFDEDSTKYVFLDREKDLITMGYIYSENPYAQTLEIHRLELVSIIKKWSDLCKSKPKVIIITRENDTFKIEGKN